MFYNNCTSHHGKEVTEIILFIDKHNYMIDKKNGSHFVHILILLFLMQSKYKICEIYLTKKLKIPEFLLCT